MLLAMKPMNTSSTQAELDQFSERPLMDEQLATLPRVPLNKTIYRALGLTQQEFVATYRNSLGSVRHWETSKSEPIASARARLNMIAKELKMTTKALQRRHPA